MWDTLQEFLGSRKWCDYSIAAPLYAIFITNLLLLYEPLFRKKLRAHLEKIYADNELIDNILRVVDGTAQDRVVQFTCLGQIPSLAISFTAVYGSWVAGIMWAFFAVLLTLPLPFVLLAQPPDYLSTTKPKWAWLRFCRLGNCTYARLIWALLLIGDSGLLGATIVALPKAS